MSSSPQHWRLETDADGIAWLTFDLQGSSTNTLGSAPMRELNDRLAEIEAARPRAVVLRSAKDSGFVAGADITEFASLTDLEQAYQLVRTGQKVFDRLEALPMPTVAAIHGFALGGGLELALACDYRVGADDGKLNLGLPEVMLGVHPGFGGTVRTPRLIGAPAALDLMLTGKSLRADEALKLGLVDRLVPREKLADAAREIARNAPPAGARPSASASSPGRCCAISSRPRPASRWRAARIPRTTPPPTPSSNCSSATAPRARPPSKRKRARSRGSSSASSRGTWSASSSCRTA